MTLSEFKNRLASYVANKKYDEEYDETLDLLLDWNGHDDITINTVNEYNCTLGNVISTLDNMGVNHDLEYSDSGMYVRISICR